MLCSPQPHGAGGEVGSPNPGLATHFTVLLIKADSCIYVPSVLLGANSGQNSLLASAEVLASPRAGEDTLAALMLFFLTLGCPTLTQHPQPFRAWVGVPPLPQPYCVSHLCASVSSSAECRSLWLYRGMILMDQCPPIKWWMCLFEADGRRW